MLHLFTRFILLIVLLGGVAYIFVNYKPSVSGSSEIPIKEETDQLIEECGSGCEQKIRELINQAVATLSAKPTTQAKAQVKPTTTLAPSTQVQYINLNNVGLTTRNDWTDLDGTDFSYDPGTYGNVKEVHWVPRIKTTNGGEASSRLFDVTNGTSVPGSEVSTTNYKSFTEVKSGVLTLSDGKNTFRVQIKSASGYEANFEKGKLKIVIVN